MAIPDGRHSQIAVVPEFEEIGFDPSKPLYSFSITEVDFDHADLVRAMFEGTLSEPVTIPLRVGHPQNSVTLEIVVEEIRAWHMPLWEPRRRKPYPRDQQRQWCVTGYVRKPPAAGGLKDGTGVRLLLGTYIEHEDGRRRFTEMAFQFDEPS